MKDFILIIILIIITFWAINLLNYKEKYVFDIINNINVSENNTEMELITSKKIDNFRWFYEYEVKDKCLYISTYKVVNPISKKIGALLEIDINKGYNDFDKIYLNDYSGDKIIWSNHLNVE